METLYLANRYRIDRLLGKGGMAAVFLAWDTHLEVERAVKLLHPSLILNEGIRTRFRKEALAMAKLAHPNIIHVYDHGTEGTTLYLVMEYISGGSLEHYIQQNPLSIGQAIQVMLDICTGLSAAHDTGYIHRDIKPENMLVSDNRIVLADFGLVHIPETSNTQTKAIMGTLQYMPPEQRISAKRTTTASDIYALVASFFRMITQEYPEDLFDKETRNHSVQQLPLSIQNIIHKGCDEHPSARYGSASELRAELERLTQQFPLAPIIVKEPSGFTDNVELHSLWSEYMSIDTSVQETQSTSQEFLGASTLPMIQEEATIPAHIPSTEPPPSASIGDTKQESLSKKRDLLPWGMSFIFLAVLIVSIFVMNEQSTPLPSGSRIIPLKMPKQNYMFFQYHGGIIAVTLEKVDDDNQEYEVFWGSDKNLFGQPIISSGRSMNESWSFGFWDSRLDAGYQRSVGMKNDTYTLQCGETKHSLQKIDPPSDIQWFASKWARQLVLFAKTSDFQYILIDKNRFKEIPEYRVFMGTKGAMKELVIQAQDIGFQKYHIQTTTGTIQIKEKTGTWNNGTEEKALKTMELWKHAKMIYTELGVYPDKGLGTPCDFMFQTKE